MIDFEPTYSANGSLASAPKIPDAVAFISQCRALGGKTYLLYLPHWYWQGDLGQASLAPLADLGMLLVSSDYTAYRAVCHGPPGRSIQVPTDASRRSS